MGIEKIINRENTGTSFARIRFFFAKQIVKNGKCEKCEKSRWNVVTTFSVVHSEAWRGGKIMGNIVNRGNEM